MSQNIEMEARLWEYIDGIAKPEERSVIEALIQTQQEWREKYQEMVALHQDLQEHLELEAPSLRFTKNVMEEIARLHIAPATSTYINKKIIYGIAGFFITLIVGFVIYAIAQIDWSSGSGSGGFEWNRIDFSGIFNNQFVNIFMMVNIVLGLMLFDRYLTAQKKNWKKQAS
ncbi:hypothetical protein GCM10027036_04570 [Flavihumibacter cheonanensis]|uniref:Uncharacterized protein n=1 Tax=Flavihumibacter fluminis TaxID=2909236 RepID=A0ABS9BFM1_9BACT|nr:MULTISPECIES: hypothetical protein [Flavihumibacter]MCF1713634.1 hypothetical protein [Flavihumibacter fluminis]MCG7752099.1 hypothetical protein [Flavihumibacter cheonanensis]